MFTVNDGLGLSSLLLLFPQRLGGFQFVHLGETQRQQGVNTAAPLRPMGLVKAPGLSKNQNKTKKLTSGLFHWLTDGTIPDRQRRIKSRFTESKQKQAAGGRPG